MRIFYTVVTDVTAGATIDRAAGMREKLVRQRIITAEGTDFSTCSHNDPELIGCDEHQPGFQETITKLELSGSIGTTL